jgi:excisionase family DNA binding protein
MTERLLYPSAEAKAAIGCGNTKFYELIGDGELDARKLGSRTMITAESLKRYVERLPRIEPRSDLNQGRLHGNRRQETRRGLEAPATSQLPEPIPVE